MPDTNIHQVHQAIGGLASEVKGLRRDVQDDRRVSAEYRAGVRDELAKLVLRATYLETDMSSVKAKVDDIEAVTVEVTTLRNKADGAGTLGRWLIRLGIGVVTIAGWAVGAYTWMTGRPPP